MRAVPLLLLLVLGCSSAATSGDRPSDAGLDGAPVDTQRLDIAVDATLPPDIATAPRDAADPEAPLPAHDAVPGIDLAPLPDIVQPPADQGASDVVVPQGDVVVPDAASVEPFVQLTGPTLTAAMQGRLDMLYRSLSITPRRLAATTVGAADLRARVIIAAFAGPPQDWSPRASLLAESIRQGSWMLAEVYGAWPLHEEGMLSVLERQWSRTRPCTGTFFWLRAAPEVMGHPLFAGLSPWLPTPATIADGEVFSSYSMGSADMSVPLFGAQGDTQRTRYPYLQYVESYCEGDVSNHPWCLENRSRCPMGGSFGVVDAWVDEFRIGRGGVIVVQTGPHQTGGWQWGEVTRRLQANALRYAETRVMR